jgi:hypothetical protein
MDRAPGDARSITVRVPDAVAAALATLLFLSGCVSREHREAEEARKAYHESLSRHPSDASQCDPEWQRYNAAVERYEKNSRRAWGCVPAQGECPRQR